MSSFELLLADTQNLAFNLTLAHGMDSMIKPKMHSVLLLSFVLGSGSVFEFDQLQNLPLTLLLHSSYQTLDKICMLS